MRQWQRFVSFGLVTLTTVALTANRSARAASVASDNVCNPPYNGTNWSNGQNGGTGFGTWSLFQTGAGTFSFFTGSAANNGNNCSSGSGINGSCAKAWGAFAGSGSIASARRAFTGSPSALQTNQSFTFSIDNGYINTGGAVGLALENSINNSVWEFLYVGGNSGSHYSINDGSGSNATTVGYTEGGLVVVFTLTSSTTYSVAITPVGGSTTTVTGTLQNPVGGQAISQFRFYNNEPSSGNGCNYNAYLNAISVACAKFTVTAPANQSVCAGNTASFSISAGAANSPLYQWQVSTNSGAAWNAVSTGMGGTTPSFTTAATTAGDNGDMFRCLVTDACNSNVTSAAASLTVIGAAPSITTQPTGQGVCGSSATFTVVASNAISYLWYKGPTGSGVALNNGGSISGATTATLTLSGIMSGDNGANFYVVVSGCSSPQTSAGAVLTLNTAPSISGQPANQIACDGSTAGFNVAASGSPLNFAWRKHGTGWGAGHAWTLSAANGGGSLSVASSSQNGGGGATPNIDTSGQAWALYNVSNTATTITTAVRSFPAALLVGQQFQIDMDNGYINSPNTVGFSLLNASGNIVWELYIGGSTPYLIHDNSGAAITTGAAYTEGGIRVVFTLTSATTYSTTVTVLSSGIAYGPITGTLLNPTGGSVPAQVRLYDAAGQGGNNYNLYFNNLIVAGTADDNAANYSSSTWASGQTPNFGNIPLSDGGSISGSTTSNLTLTGISTNDSGATFDCVVVGRTSCGNVNSSTATLTVYPQTGSCILTQPRGVSTYLGGNAVFTVPAQALSYQWYKGASGGGVALSDGGSVSGSASPTLTLSSVTLADNGASFYVIVGCCGGAMQASDNVGLSVSAASDGFLKASGLNIRNAHGTGDIVPLHGVNFGAWLLMEGWMCPMDTAGLPDFFLVVQTLATRFGTNTEESLVRTYQDTWIMTNDLDNVRAMGMNMIRVPVMWTDLQRLDGTWRVDAYDRLDWVVSNAWQRGIYTLIDFHGVPGGVSSAQSAGMEDNAYWTSTNYQNQTALIWSNMATHFTGNPAVAGYDLVNEPYGAPTQQAIWDMYNSLYHVVRGIDPDHIIMMEATWKGTGTTNNSLNWVWDVLPPPTLYGWSNVVYSLHEYHFEDTTDVGPVLTGMVNQVIDYNNHKSWNVPDYIGEFNMFTPTNGAMTATAVWQYGIQLLNSNNISWTVWAYKATHGTLGAVPDSWGLYDYVGTIPPAPNTQADPSSTISNDWTQCATSIHFAINPMLQNSLGGPLAVSDLYVTTAGTTLSVDSASGVLGNDLDINLGQPGIQLTAALMNAPINGQLALNPDGSFSYTPNAGFSGTDTFRYQVNDGYAASINIATVTILVNPSSSPAPTFDQWQSLYFGCTNCPQALANTDPLGKGISNTNQFLLGLNPTNPASVFRIISATPQGADMMITWKTAGVRTNALQASSGTNYGTNGFADISGPVILNVNGDTTTNYTDIGGATNVPSRFYRVRLVP